MPPNVPRRAFLRTGGALTTVGATGGLAGCLDGLLRTGTDEPSPVTTVRRWIPARNVVSGTVEKRAEQYGVSYWNFDAVIDADDRVDGDLLEGVTFWFEDRFGTFDLTAEDVSARLHNPYWDVLRWDHDPGETARTLEDAGFESAVEHRGFEVFVPADSAGPAPGDDSPGRDESGTYAFDGHHLVYTDRDLWLDERSANGIRLLLDARSGERDRFATENDTVDELLDVAHAGDTLSVTHFETGSNSRSMPEYGIFEGLVARCASGHFVEEQFRRQDLYEFQNREAVDADAIDQYVTSLENETESCGHATDTAVDRRGRLVEITSDIPLESLGE